MTTPRREVSWPGRDGGSDWRTILSSGEEALPLCPRPRKYPQELLDRGVRLVLESGRPIAHVAKDIGLPPESLRRWASRSLRAPV